MERCGTEHTIHRRYVWWLRRKRQPIAKGSKFPRDVVGETGPMGPRSTSSLQHCRTAKKLQGLSVNKRLSVRSCATCVVLLFLFLFLPLNRMGVTVSREFSDAVASCVNKGSGLENLLEDPEVVNSSIFLIDAAN